MYRDINSFGVHTIHNVALLSFPPVCVDSADAERRGAGAFPELPAGCESLFDARPARGGDGSPGEHASARHGRSDGGPGAGVDVGHSGEKEQPARLDGERHGPRV